MVELLTQKPQVTQDDSVPLSTFKASKILGTLKAAADFNRLAILKILAKGSFGVQELSKICAMPQPGMSHHLKILTASQLIEPRKEGNCIFYRRTIFADDELTSALFKKVDLLPLSESFERRLLGIYHQRAQSSLEFFNKYSDQFRDHQKLICEFEHYKSGLLQLLGSFSGQHSSVLEVGPGDGDLLIHLRQHFNQVTAMDNSVEMLRRTQTFCRQNNLNDIEILEGDLHHSIDSQRSFDMIILNMVLHHLATPPNSLAQVYQRLVIGGALLIADLTPHQQDWVRGSCGDLWLGFEPDELESWTKEIGFEPGPLTFVSLKNGFQIQLRLFYKF